MTKEALEELKEAREKLARLTKGAFSCIDKILRLVIQTEEEVERKV